MNPLQMLMGMNNPQQMISNLLSTNPQLMQYVQTAQKMTQGKSPEQIQMIANNLAKENGVDMNQVNNMIQQFMSGNMKF